MKPIFLLLLVAAGCTNSGQERVSIPLYVAGTSLPETLTTADGAVVTIDSADLAFGPLYLCAGTSAGDLCEVARAEWLDSSVVDTTSNTPVLVGKLTGNTGTVQSWMYDLGISSSLIRNEPFELDAAKQIGNTSFAVSGNAQFENTLVPFSASIPTTQTNSAESGLPVIRKSNNEPFYHEITGAETGLLIRFDAAGWIERSNFASLLANASCRVDQNQKACTDRTVVSSESETFRSLSNALVSGTRPTFQWNHTQ